MSFASGLDALLAAADKPALARELGTIEHKIIELEAGRVCIGESVVIGLLKMRRDQIRGLLGRGEGA